MKVLITSDVAEWAIGNLTRSIINNNDHIEFIWTNVHPRDYEAGCFEIRKILKEEKIDLWHVMYWNSGKQVRIMNPQINDIPSVLSHHNHYALDDDDWSQYSAITIPTKWGLNKLKPKYPNTELIPYGIDLDTFSYINEYPPKEPRVGYIGRVIEHKNLDKVCSTAKELGYKVIGSGYIDKPNYWKTIDKENLEWTGGVGRQGIPDKNFKDNIYKKMTVFVMYSTGERETGTLPLLEAMARGVPIMATAQGMARDLIEDGENGFIFDESNFKEKLDILMKDRKMQSRFRKNAWNTIKSYTEQRMAREYSNLYYKTLWPNKKVISVIIPTFNRADRLLESILEIEKDPYDAKEIVVCDDGSTDHTFAVVNELRKKIHTPIKYFKTGDEKSGYGLARARNKGAIEASGEVLMFLDDRMKITPGALEYAVNYVRPKVFQFGKKIINGKLSTKTAFMENFSWILKKDFINAGMFCERMEYYGGLSDETRRRFANQGFKFELHGEFPATEMMKSKSSKRKDEIWKSKLIIRKMYE